MNSVVTKVSDEKTPVSDDEDEVEVGGRFLPPNRNTVPAACRASASADIYWDRDTQMSYGCTSATTFEEPEDQTPTASLELVSEVIAMERVRRKRLGQQHPAEGVPVRL